MKYTPDKIKKIHHFIDLLFNPDDHVALTCFPDTEELKHKKSRAFNFVLQRDELKAKYLNIQFLSDMTSKFYSVCVSPNPIKPGKKRSNDNVEMIRTLFVDIDSTQVDISKIKPTPSMVCKRKANKVHVYWFIKPVKNTKKNAQLFHDVEVSLIDRLGGDKQVKDRSRPLRLPYTFHMKNGGKSKASFYNVVKTSNAFYKLEELNERLNKHNKTANDTEEAKGTGGAEEAEPAFVDSDKAIVDFLKQSYKQKSPVHQGEGRSQELYYVGTDCFKWGLPKKTALEVARLFNDKVCKPPEDDRALTHQIDSAYKYTKDDFGEYRTNLKGAGTASKRNEQFRDHQENQRLRTELKGSVFIKETEKFYGLSSGLGYVRTQIKAQLLDTFHTRKSMSEIIYERLIRVVEREDFRPDIDDRFFESKDVRYLNRFRPIEIEEVGLTTPKAKKSINLFLEHFKYLSTSDYEYETLLDAFTFLVQNPGAKLSYAILITSRFQGIGKSILEILLRNIFGNYIGALENSSLSSGYTEYVIDKIVIFVHELYQGDKYQTMNQLKNLITEPKIRINEKYVKSYEGTNCANFIMFSNRVDAVFTDEYDRRLFVIRNEKTPKDQKYYKELVKTFQENFDILYTFLVGRDISHFNPFERPEKTEGKKMMIEQSTPELVLYLEGLRAEQKGPFEHDIIIVADVLAYIDLWAPGALKRFVGIKSVSNFLLTAGYERKKISWREGGQVKGVSGWHLNWPKVPNPSQAVRELISGGQEYSAVAESTY